MLPPGSGRRSVPPMTMSATAQWAKSHNLTYVGFFIDKKTLKFLKKAQTTYGRNKGWVASRAMLQGLQSPPTDGFQP